MSASRVRGGRGEGEGEGEGEEGRRGRSLCPLLLPHGRRLWLVNHSKPAALRPPSSPPSTVPTLVARFARKCVGLAAVVWALLTFDLPLVPRVIVQCE